MVVGDVVSQECRKCGEVKPVAEFTKKSTTTGYITVCKPCRSQRESERYDASERHQRAVAERAARRSPERIEAARRHQRVKSGRRRAALAGAPICDLTRGEWAVIIDEFGTLCAYCGTSEAGTVSGRMTQDHVVPLSRDGSHTVGNVVPACRPCNSAKRARTGDEFLTVLTQGVRP